MVGEVSSFWEPVQYVNTRLQFCISLIFMFLFETLKHKTTNHVMIISILMFVYSAEIRTIKMVLSHCALSLIGSLNWCRESCIGWRFDANCGTK